MYQLSLQHIQKGKTDRVCYYFKKLQGFISHDIFPHNMFPSYLQSAISALIVHTFCSTDLHSFDLKGISLHLLPFISSESSAAPVGAGFAFLWERCALRLGMRTFFLYTWRGHEIWHWHTEAGARADRQNTERGCTGKTGLMGRNCWPSQQLLRCEVRVPFLSRHTVCKWQPASVKYGELKR